MKNEKEIREKFNELRDSFLKSKIKEIRKDLYRRENKKKIATPEIKEIEENLELANSALITIILNIKVKEIKTKFYQIKNILI